MLWKTLINHISKVRPAVTNYEHVYLLSMNKKTNKLEKVYLVIKYDAKGKPYFVEIDR